MKKVLLTLAVVAMFVVSASAQLTFGARAGLNLANVSGDVEDNSMLIGFQVGAIADYALSDAFSVQTGLLLSQKGAKYEMGDETAKATANYLEIPIHGVYALDMGGNTLQLFAGPYIGVGLFGKITSDAEGWEDIDMEFVSDAKDVEDAAPVSMLDYGVNFGVGYKMNNIQIQAQYGLGLANTLPKFDGESPEDKVTNTNIQLSLTYFFGN